MCRFAYISRIAATTIKFRNIKERTIIIASTSGNYQVFKHVNHKMTFRFSYISRIAAATRKFINLKGTYNNYCPYLRKFRSVQSYEPHNEV